MLFRFWRRGSLSPFSFEVGDHVLHSSKGVMFSKLWLGGGRRTVSLHCFLLHYFVGHNDIFSIKVSVSVNPRVFAVVKQKQKKQMSHQEQSGANFQKTWQKHRWLLFIWQRCLEDGRTPCVLVYAAVRLWKHVWTYVFSLVFRFSFLLKLTVFCHTFKVCRLNVSTLIGPATK